MTEEKRQLSRGEDPETCFTNLTPSEEKTNQAEHVVSKVNIYLALPLLFSSQQPCTRT